MRWDQTEFLLKGLYLGLLLTVALHDPTWADIGLVTGNRRRIPDRAGYQPPDAVTECGDVLTRKSWPAAFGGAPTEHAEEIDHPRLLAFRDDPARSSRDLPRRPQDSPTQHE